MAPYADRQAAGRTLAARLEGYRGRSRLVVLGLPRGGVPVAREVADALAAPLDVLVVRKLGAPGQPELAVGALAGGGVRVLNDDVVVALGLHADQLDELARREAAEIARREAAYRGGRPAPELAGTTALLVDDGLATGATMSAAVVAVRRLGAAFVVVAVPVAPAATCQRLRGIADEVVCAQTPEGFIAVGAFYDDFAATTDDQVRTALSR